MHPIHLKQLAGLLRSLVDAQRQAYDASQNQIAATRNASEAANEQIREIPRVIIQAVEAANEDVPSYTKAQHKRENAQRKLEYRIQKRVLCAAWVTAVATCLAFVAAGIYAYIAAQQRDTMNRTYAEIQKQTKAARDAAYAACINAQIARSTLLEIRAGGTDSHNLAIGSILQAAAVTRAESAQIVISLVGNATVAVEDTGEAGLAFAIANIGKTSANRVHVRMMAVVVNKGEEPNFRYAPHEFADRGTVDPGPSIGGIPEDVLVGETDKHREFTAAEINEIRQGTNKRIFFYARADYVDVFGVRHWTQYCGESHSDGPYWKVPKCAAYNRTDTNQVAKIKSLEVSRNTANTPQEPVCEKPKD